MTIACCMIVKDEEANIEECLYSVARYVDYVYIVDTGSTDRTVDLIRRIRNEVGEKLYLSRVQWQNSFATHRNESLNAAKYTARADWAFVLDADQRLLRGECLAETVARAGEDDESFLCRETHKGYQHVGYIQRLFRLRSRRHYHGSVHEQLVDGIGNDRVSVKASTSDIHIHNIGYADDEVVFEKLMRNRRMLVKWLAKNMDDEFRHMKLSQTYASIEEMRRKGVTGRTTQ